MAASEQGCLEFVLLFEVYGTIILGKFSERSCFITLDPIATFVLNSKTKYCLDSIFKTNILDRILLSVAFCFNSVVRKGRLIR